MPRNKLTDLNNHLFEQLERLNDEELSDEQLEKEVKRAKSITEIAQKIIDNGNLLLNSTKYINSLDFNKDTQTLVNNMLLSDKNEK